MNTHKMQAILHRLSKEAFEQMLCFPIREKHYTGQPVIQYYYISKHFLTPVEAACLKAEGVTLIFVAAHYLNSMRMAHHTFDAGE